MLLPQFESSRGDLAGDENSSSDAYAQDTGAISFYTQPT